MTKYEEMKLMIEEQERMLRVDKLSNEDGLKLGLFLLEEAKAQGLSMAISVRKANGALLFHHLMEGTNPNNQGWMLRKFNTVMLWEHASLYAYAHEHVTGETVYDHGRNQTDYVFCGGGFPILNKNGELLGAICVSNLPHVLDHKFLVDAYAKYLGVSDLKTITE